MDSPMNPNSLAPRGISTEAVAACKQGNLELMQKLIGSDSILNVKNFCRWNRQCGFYEKHEPKDVIVHRELVCIAALNGHGDLVNYLLELGALGSRPDKIARAIELGCGEALQLFIHQDPHVVNRMRYNRRFFGDTYQSLCFKGLPRWKNRLALDILYSNGADPNLESNCMCSAVRSGDPEIVELVKAYGCNDDERWYLEVAASSGLIEMVQHLLDTGADIDASYPAKNFTWTALHGAAFMGDLKMVEFLLESGADPNVLSEYRSHGRLPVRLTPGQVARGADRDEIQRRLSYTTSSSSRSSSFSEPLTPTDEVATGPNDKPKLFLSTDSCLKGRLVPTALSPLIETFDLNEN